MDDWRVPKPDIVFTRKGGGKLIFFCSSHIRVYRARPPLAWIKTEGRGWRHSLGHDSDLNIRAAASWVGRYAELRRSNFMPRNREAISLMRFLRCMPIEMRRIAVRARRGAWILYRLLYRCPGAVELAQTNFGLAYALSAMRIFKGAARCPQRPLRSARAFLRRPRRKIAGHLGFEESNAAVKVLSRVPASSTSISSLLFLRNALKRREARKVACHLPRLNEAVIYCLNEEAIFRMASPRFLEEVGQEKGLDYHSGEFVFRLRLLQQSYQETSHRTLVLRSLGHLLQLTGQNRGDLGTSFGPPPLPGIPGLIEPVTTRDKLEETAARMQNCLASDGWVTRLSIGRHSVYQVADDAGESTLSLRRRGDRWEVDEMLGAKNGRPPDSAVRLVQDWLGQAPPGILQDFPHGAMHFAREGNEEDFDVFDEDEFLPF